MKDIDSSQEFTFKENETFRKIVEQKGGNKANIGRRLGNVSGQLIGQYIQGRQKPKEDFFKKWEAAYGENIRHAFETNVSYEAEEATNVRIGYDMESRRTLERTLENLSEDKKRSTAIIERLVTLLERSFSSGELSTTPAEQGAKGTLKEVPSEPEDLSLDKKYSGLNKTGTKNK